MAERASYWQRRASRRRFLASTGAVAGGTLALALAGCGDDDDQDGGSGSPAAGGSPAPTRDPSGIPKDGIIKLRQLAPFSNINPFRGLDSGLLWGFTIYDHLWYTPSDTGIPELFLAESIEQPDPLRFTARIQPAVFHDKPPASGRPVRAQDIKASFEAAAASQTISRSNWWTDVMEKVEAPDEKTVVVTMKSVDAWTFTSTNAGSPIASSILPEEHAKQNSLMDKDLVGSGRHEFVSHQNGTNFKLKRFDKWRIKGEPYLAGLEYKLIQDQALALAAFSAKDIDSVVPNNKLERDQLVQKHGQDIEVETNITGSVWTLLGRGDGQWKDARVAQAISLALDKAEYINLMNFGDGVKTGPVPPNQPVYALNEQEVASTYGKFDPAEARRLLGASGFDTSKEYSIKYILPGDRFAQFAQITQAQLQKNLGLKTRIVGEDFGKWLGQSLYGSDYDGFMSFPSLIYDDPSSYIGGYAKLNAGRPNYARFENDELDALVKNQRAIIDTGARVEAIKSIQRKAWELGAPIIPVFVAIGGTVYWSHVKGRITGRGSYGLFNGKLYIDK